ncbi:class I SAM-dependent methyltransferase [Nocardioides terrisoli]|uniref:class I SAM-dependent methyltransferase n=1 Tax=Nocardioides terrisoli TaxID=3388267 RepID=UPI00287BADAA|nr:methyltransferase domain-containing protein [Nocardioides marmorisolisilvae]
MNETTSMGQPAGRGVNSFPPGYHDDVRRDVAPYVPAAGGTLLDVGGGTGATAAHFRSLGLAERVGAVDRISSDLADPSVDFHESGDLEDQGFLATVIERHGPFQTILCLDILEHLVDPWRVIETLHHALVPGGRIVASIPNVRHYRVSGGLFLRNRWHLMDSGILDRTHLRFFVKETAIELMTHTGLELEEVVTPDRGRHPRLARTAQHLGLGSLVAVDYVVRVRRSD